MPKRVGRAAVRFWRFAARVRRVIADLRVPATPLARATIWAAGGVDVWLGLALIYSGPERMSGPSYEAIREMPGAPQSLGLAILLFGLAILLGSGLPHWGLKAIGLLGSSSWMLAFGSGTLYAGAVVPTAGVVGGPVLLYVFLSHAILIWVREGNAHPAA